ncbi:MAG: hypothetical protein WDA12_02970 [Bacilli bacterium]
MEKPKNIKRKDNDVTNEEWKKLHVPFNDNLNDYLTRYVIPEVVSFSIANSYYRGCLCSSTFEQHYRSMSDIILAYPSLEDVKDDIVNLLKIKYNLKVVSEDPLTLEKYQ